MDNLYFEDDFFTYCTKNYNDDDNIEIPMDKLSQFPVLFIMEIKNNELSRTMNKIKKLIDTKTYIKNYDRNTILEEFINTNIAGNIELNSVHFEVLLMNQIRSFEDELTKPDWTIPDETYQILTLGNSLSKNPSITVRLESTKPTQVLLDPNLRKLNKPSIDDLYFMEQPQEFLKNNNEDMISDKYKPAEEKDKNKIYIEPIKFINNKK
jgi:hypothetical protein